MGGGRGEYEGGGVGSSANPVPALAGAGGGGGERSSIVRCGIVAVWAAQSAGRGGPFYTQ